MDPSTIIPSESSNLQDPIKRLPREVFIQFFSSFPGKFILDSSTVSREWKDVILSSPTSFENLELSFEDQDPGEENNLAQHAIANKVVRRILGYANLSNNRLKSVKLFLHPFRQDVRNAYSNWNSTRFSALFSILRWSSSTLTNLRLYFYHTKSELADAILHVAAVVRNLDGFKSLRTVEIDAELGLYLGSSSLSKFKKIRVSDINGSREWDDVEVDEVHGSTLAILFRQITQFTGHGIEDLKLNWGYPVSLEALKELEKSKEALLELWLDLTVEDELSESQLQFALSCPNLTRLSLEIWNLGGGGGRESLRLETPKDKKHPNKLKNLVIDNAAGAALILADEFCRNVALENLSIEQEELFSDPPSTDSRSIRQILQSSSCSLRSIHLGRIKINSVMADGLQLHHLVKLSVSGNASLIELFLDINYFALKVLSLRLWIADVDGSESVDHCKIIQILQSCQSSLEQVNIWLDCGEKQASTDFPSQEVAKTISEDHRSPLTLTQVSQLSLILQDDLIEKHYLPMKYPNLSRVGLPKSSKLSQSDFSLKPQDSALK